MLPLDVALCIIATAVIQKNIFRKECVLTYIGKNSLTIYLWHVLPIIVLKAIHLSDKLYYVISFGLLILFIVTIKHFHKI